MASCSSSIIGVSSIYQTPSSEQPRRPTSSLLPFAAEKTHFNGLKASAASFRPKLAGCGLTGGGPSSVSTAVASPNFSLLREEAFKGLEGFGDSDSEYESEGDELEGSSSGVASSVDELSVSNLGLPQRLVDSLANRGITELFPIQRAVLVPALEGRDIIARAKTGTGKTLAFGIPVLKRLSEDERSSLRRGRLPRMLVLAPTRELASQVDKELKESAPYLSTVCVYGGVSYNLQQNALSRGVDIVVGTPGRLIDLIKSKSLQLGEVEYIVLDEADQMLAVGFEEDVETILENLPAKRQSMLFSATMPVWVKKLARKYLNNPLTIDLVGDQDEKLAEGIKLYAIQTTGTSKRTILSDLVTVYAKGGKAIVFTQTKRDADEVSLSLTASLPSEALHGDISQHQRERTLNGFRQGKFMVLVATDVAARGLDIPNVDLVIHYELPNDSETFVHRSGRTGRAGKEGAAILMFTNNQRRTVKTIERDVGCHFEYISPPSVEDMLEKSAEQVVATLRAVHPQSVEFFTPTAQKLFEEKGTDALAAALAQLSGFSQPPSSRSLLTHEQGWITLQLTRDPGFSNGFLSARSVTGFLSDVYSTAADEVGKIQLIADGRIQGAVFDLPEEIAKELLKKQIPPGNTVTRVTKLPTLQDDGPATDRYGKFSNRDRGSRGGYGGGSRDQRGGSRSSRGSFGRSSGGDRDGYGSRSGGDRDGYSSRSGGRGRSENSWSRSSRDSSRDGGSRDGGSTDWLIGLGRQSDRPSSFGDRGDRFGGACFNCGRSGHRASECPTKRSY